MKVFLFSIYMFIVATSLGVALAQVNPPTPTVAAPAVPAQTMQPASTQPVVPAIVQKVADASSNIPEPSKAPPWIFAVVGFLVTDVMARVMPTRRPQNWFVWIGMFLNGVGAVCTKLGNWANVLSDASQPKV